jgi:hypothetical protein
LWRQVSGPVSAFTPSSIMHIDFAVSVRMLETGNAVLGSSYVLRVSVRLSSRSHQSLPIATWSLVFIRTSHFFVQFSQRSNTVCASSSLAMQTPWNSSNAWTLSLMRGLSTQGYAVIGASPVSSLHTLQSPHDSCSDQRVCSSPNSSQRIGSWAYPQESVKRRPLVNGSC